MSENCVEKLPAAIRQVVTTAEGFMREFGEHLFAIVVIENGLIVDTMIMEQVDNEVKGRIERMSSWLLKKGFDVVLVSEAWMLVVSDPVAARQIESVQDQPGRMECLMVQCILQDGTILLCAKISRTGEGRMDFTLGEWENVTPHNTLSGRFGGIQQRAFPHKVN